MPPDPQTLRNPPIEYAVAVWVGMSDDEIERGLREGWIRGGPQSESAYAATTIAQAPADSIVGPTAPLEPQALNREGVFELLKKLDAALDPATFEAAWHEAGASDDTRVGRFGVFLSRALGVSEEAEQAADFSTLDAAASSMSGEARFVRLAGRSGSELESMARGDASIRAALASGERWALAGDRALTARGDPAGRFDRFDRDTGEQLVSDHWIHDRARYTAWRAASEEGTRETVDGPGWRFVDRAHPPASFELAGSDGDIVHQVVFARDGGDRVTGGRTTDRIHGGSGDDLLIGRGGDDLIEGSRGDDFILGGGGRDELSGESGADAIDGGSGDDRLDAGRGNDELTGGRGDDRLRGGEGDDVYRFDAGDGFDSVDDDGGALVFDDATLSGTMRRDGDAWTSENGALRFTHDGSPQAGGTLTIVRTDVPGDAVRIDAWRQGAWGFSLETENGGENGQVPVPTRDTRHTQSESVSSGQDGGTAFDLSSLALDPLGDAALVDERVLEAALDGWGIPAPPDFEPVRDSDIGFVNDTVLTDALASGSFGEAADAGGVPPLDWSAMLQPPTMPDAALAPLRPSPLIRAVTP